MLSFALKNGELRIELVPKGISCDVHFDGKNVTLFLTRGAAKAVHSLLGASLGESHEEIRNGKLFVPETGQWYEINDFSDGEIVDQTEDDFFSTA